MTHPVGMSCHVNLMHQVSFLQDHVDLCAGKALGSMACSHHCCGELLSTGKIAA